MSIDLSGQPWRIIRIHETIEHDGRRYHSYIDAIQQVIWLAAGLHPEVEAVEVALAVARAARIAAQAR
jgi:hypothetical protein